FSGAEGAAMSVTHFIPSGLRVSHRVKPREMPVTLRFPLAHRTSSAVTTERRRAVGDPANVPSVTIPADDPLVAEAVTTGFESLAILERRTREVVRELRWQRLANGRRGLTELVHGTQALVMLAASTSAAVGQELDLMVQADGLSASEATRRAVN